MKKVITISRQYRQGIYGDLPAVPKIIIANHYLRRVCNFEVGQKILVNYSKNTILITNLNQEYEHNI